MITITYDNIKHLLDNWDCDIQLDINDLDSLDEFLAEHSCKVDIALSDLGKLYNRFSEEVWSAGWEDNAEGQFIKWLEENIKKNND